MRVRGISGVVGAQLLELHERPELWVFGRMYVLTVCDGTAADEHQRKDDIEDTRGPELIAAGPVQYAPIVARGAFVLGVFPFVVLVVGLRREENRVVLPLNRG